VCVYVYIHIHIHTYIYIYICRCVYVYTYIYMYMFIIIYTHTYILSVCPLTGGDMTHIFCLAHSCAWHDSFMYVTCLIYVCDVTHSCTWHDSFMYVPRRMCHDSFIHVTSSMHRGERCWKPAKKSFMWAMTPSHVTRLIHICAATDSYIFPHDSFIYVPWLPHTSQGEEVLISYRKEMNNRIYQVQFLKSPLAAQFLIKVTTQLTFEKCYKAVRRREIFCKSQLHTHFL